MAEVKAELGSVSPSEGDRVLCVPDCTSMLYRD